MISASVPRVLLAGNPNSGKSTLFNALTGARQKVGNYPGVTVEKREGRARIADHAFHVLDLPGTFSLGSYSPEERIAQEELLAASDDEVVVLVADAMNVERSLVLLAQLFQLPRRFVLCLNMVDEAAAAGQQIDVARLRARLGIPVAFTVGHRRLGMPGLEQAILEAQAAPPREPRCMLGEPVRSSIERIADSLRPSGLAPALLLWTADRLLVGDTAAVRSIQARGAAGLAALEAAEVERAALENETGEDTALHVTSRCYAFAADVLRDALVRPARSDARGRSDRIDQVLVHRYLGLPIFLATMYAVFWLTFTVGEAPMGWIESAFGALGALVAGAWPEGSTSPLRSLLVDGVIGGAGGVVVFVPNILLLYVGLAALEDSGYLARAAFLMDRSLHRFGLHGRSFVPMLTGFGCSIPGIMATRTMENARDRLATMMVVPLMSCGARLPIWMLLVPAFFAAPWRAPALWGIYVFGVVLALLVALALRHSLLRGNDAPFVMELPPYRVPLLSSVLGKAAERSWLYLRKAGTVILGISILMWFITSYPKASDPAIDREIAAGLAVIAETPGQALPGAPRQLTEEQAAAERAAEDLSSSMAGRIGHLLEPALRPMGLDWKTGTGLVGAFAAKEVFVAQLGIVHAIAEPDSESVPLRAALARDYPPHAGIALMLFLLIATPCMATVAVTRRESGRWSWALLQFGGLTALGYVIAVFAFQIGRFFV